MQPTAVAQQVPHQGALCASVLSRCRRIARMSRACSQMAPHSRSPDSLGDSSDQPIALSSTQPGPMLPKGCGHPGSRATSQRALYRIRRVRDPLRKPVIQSALVECLNSYVLKRYAEAPVA